VTSLIESVIWLMKLKGRPENGSWIKTEPCSITFASYCAFLVRCALVDFITPIDYGNSGPVAWYQIVRGLMTMPVMCFDMRLYVLSSSERIKALPGSICRLKSSTLSQNLIHFSREPCCQIQEVSSDIQQFLLTQK
jgi:hypothetical protein